MSEPPPQLTSRIVVWIAHLSQAKDALPVLEAWLDKRDCERADRFRFAADRARFVLGRGLVRKGLGHYLARTPESIELAYTDLGRPFFPHDEKIQFSISHTQDLVAVALTAGARVGIDLEAVNNHPDLLELAERIFSPADLQLFQSLATGEKLPAFYRAWTRKEAYLKARGEGIAEALRQISVSLGPETTHSIEDRRGQPPQTWRLVSLPLPSTYAGALACDDETRRLEGAFVHFAGGEIVTDTGF